VLIVPYWLGIKAEVLHWADCVPEALEAISEADARAEASGERWWRAELHRLRGVFLTAMDADKTQIEAAFGEAIRTAKQQESISLLKRAEASYADYRCSCSRGRESGGIISL
jgi:predicted ATPase